MYVFRDRRISEALVKRAEKAGYKAIVATVDNLGAVYSGHADRYEYGIKIKRVRANFVDINLPDLDAGLQAKMSSNQLRNDSYDPALSWADLDWLRSLTRLPLIVKGIQTGADARLCVEHGVQGIVVSNHGGHDVDAARASIDALPEVADAVGGRAEIYMDGGVRKGTDILKALALGARAVFIRQAHALGPRRRWRGRGAPGPGGLEGRAGRRHGDDRSPERPPGQPRADRPQ